ncbi:PREDICTED: pentatricopeptide repeat-containing protein At2g20710, mitochondrial-like isoform X1 [Nelumbo nucifera]|uniref:Pentatricopeptide repeat-containing protein At2g20710, mitochondrial-like isoform X1 n=1 Tax=Nelumbo nucifera TaxID=4432 RepID=A0A1U8AWC9_NELNU|nr:PREDICTED: pentatricopeptide repeat-containing protein At2g20710, mitochondrial-like isoform X1 [Nelumbo nucifera]
MKLVSTSRILHRQSSRFRDLFFSTETLTSPSPDSLYERIAVTGDPKISVVPVLEKWVDEGRSVNKVELNLLIRKLKFLRKFKHALEISQWMTNRRYFELSPSDAAMRLDLISKVHGLEHAEKYFASISNKLKALKTYGALLNCYVREKSVEKAEALVQNMKSMGFATTSFPYNMLIILYFQTGQHEKIDILMQEMKEKGILHDQFTLNNQLSAFASASNVRGMEETLNQMEKDPYITIDWNTYAIIANGYIKAGLFDNALAMLKKMERIIITQRSTTVGLDYLLSLYSSMGRKDELYRVWNLYKLSGKRNSSYCCMITSLAKLDDIKGAEMIFKEWESNCAFYDFRVLNRLLVAYCKNGLFDKAELVLQKAVVGRTPYASTWNILAMGYVENKQMSKAVEMLKKAMLVAREGWRPNLATLVACLDYLEEKRDVEGVEDLVRLFRATGPLSRDLYHRLLRIYLAAGKPSSSILDQMKVDGLPINEETQTILKTGQDLQVEMLD